jgi:phosphoenolpyruvate carboxykinase (ATP)
MVPETCPDVPNEALNPREAWSDVNAYDETASHLAGRFEENFKQFEDNVSADVMAVAIRKSA